MKYTPFPSWIENASVNIKPAKYLRVKQKSVLATAKRLLTKTKKKYPGKLSVERLVRLSVLCGGTPLVLMAVATLLYPYKKTEPKFAFFLRDMAFLMWEIFDYRPKYKLMRKPKIEVKYKSKTHNLVHFVNTKYSKTKLLALYKQQRTVLHDFATFLVSSVPPMKKKVTTKKKTTRKRKRAYRKPTIAESIAYENRMFDERGRRKKTRASRTSHVIGNMDVDAPEPENRLVLYNPAHDKRNERSYITPDKPPAKKTRQDDLSAPIQLFPNN